MSGHHCESPVSRLPLSLWFDALSHLKTKQMKFLISRNDPCKLVLGGTLSLMFIQVIADVCARICTNKLPGTDSK